MEPIFPSNTNSPVGPRGAKEPKAEKVVEKIVTGEVIKKPKSLGRRFKQLFTGNESKGAMRYVFGDVLIPAFKNMLVDAVSKGAERAVYGDSSGRRSQRMDYGRPRVQYNSPIDRGYSRGRPAMLPDQPPRGGGARRRSEGEIILGSREEAEVVLERMIDIIDKYDTVTVADLHEMVGLPSSHVDNKWGWSNLNHANVTQIREGWVIELPQEEPVQ